MLTDSNLSYIQRTQFLELISEKLSFYQDRLKEHDSEVPTRLITPNTYLQNNDNNKQWHFSFTDEDPLVFFNFTTFYIQEPQIETLQKERKPHEYKCQFCSEVFTQKSSYGGHVSKQHPGLSQKYKSKIIRRNSRSFQRKAKEIIHKHIMKQL